MEPIPEFGTSHDASSSVQICATVGLALNLQPGRAEDRFNRTFRGTDESVEVNRYVEKPLAVISLFKG
jgi:hypothetical protein